MNAADLRLAPAQARELGRLVELHKPDSVALPIGQPVGITPLPVTLLCADEDLRFRIDQGGSSWRASDRDQFGPIEQAA